ncbi:DUF4339 domain-containing protein, partial [bacterium]|nr:DUF4339 domain-containing protein [bacterium]
MEPRSIDCPHCGKGLKVTKEHVNKTVSCAACGKKISLVSGPTPPKAPKPGKKSGVPKPPPVPSSAHPWQLHVHGRNVGPFGPDTVRDQLKAGKISLDTLAWKEGMDDWTPISEIPELCEAPTPPKTRPTAKTRAKTKPKEKDKAQGTERRHHYVRGGKDVVTGAWIAIGLGVILLIAILVIMNQDDEEPVQPKKKPSAGPEVKVNVIKVKSKTSSAAPKTTPDGKRLPRAARLTREKLMGEVAAGIDEWFPKAIEAHKIGVAKDIALLAAKCTKWAEDLTAGDRDWGPYKNQVDRLVEL